MLGKNRVMVWVDGIEQKQALKSGGGERRTPDILHMLSSLPPPFLSNNSPASLSMDTNSLVSSSSFTGPDSPTSSCSPSSAASSFGSPSSYLHSQQGHHLQSSLGQPSSPLFSSSSHPS